MKTLFLALSVAFAGAGMLPVTGDAKPSSATRLTIVWYEDSASPETKKVWTVRCNPARGTWPYRTRACVKLARTGVRLFRPVPRGAACTAIYGDSRLARISGVVQGRRVRATFTRTNGCEIARWDRIAGILVP